MRNRLSSLLVDAASTDGRFIVLSGDHGYSLFDALRGLHPGAFVNVGVAEQAMIGIAAGLARTGWHPCVYGLASFVPIRVLEQIKIDLCLSNLPVVMLGDGAGVVYSSLGPSHQCGEDIACLRPLPNIRIYSPADAGELEACWREARSADGPCYIRVGKADRPPVHAGVPEGTGASVLSDGPPGRGVIVATGSMVAVALAFARAHGVRCISVPRLKPRPDELSGALGGAERVIVLEEHSRFGGLWSLVVEEVQSAWVSGAPGVRVEGLGLRDRFTREAGSHQHALGEHGIADDQVEARLREWLGGVP
jgi:transketolase